ncbi:MAG TPA: ABC transporter permease [Bryobacteraceae bacterium]|nr:ABC transporter permease [Bryobacteraceae bacterium]
MSWINRLIGSLRKNRLEDQLDEEQQFHLEMRRQEFIATGIEPGEARWRARRLFGNQLLLKERTRDMDTIRWIETLWQDLRYAGRMLRKTPVFGAVVVVTLALGIGANTAIFTLINAVMLQNLPVKNPGELVLFFDGIDDGVYDGDGFPGDIFSYPAWEYFRDRNESFQELCAFRQSSDLLVMHVAGSPDSGPKEQADGHLVSGNYFAVLGVQAVIGRMLTAKDDALAAPHVAVISYDFWRRRFNLDNSVIGKSVDLNGTVFHIVGVAPREFFGERVSSPPEFWLPLSRQPQVLRRASWLANRNVHWLNLMGRLKAGVTPERAQATVNTQLQQFYAAEAGTHITPERLRQLHEAYVQLKPGGRGISWMRVMYSEPLHLLMAVVALVLLIACANVATLLLARASARSREMFARLALGASRSRLMRQLLTESLLFAILGGAAGIALAWWGVKVLSSMVRVTSVVNVQPDVVVLSVTLGLSVVTGIGFGLVPALRSSRMAGMVRSFGRSSDFGMSKFNPAHALVILQVALASVLLVGAGMLTHSLLNLQRQDLGFHRDNLLLVRTDARLAGYQPAGLVPLYQQMQDRLNALPGVLAATIAQYSPISGTSNSSNCSIEGYAPPPDKNMDVYTVEVGPRFFETLGTPLVLGRPIELRDTPAAPTVAVVNESFIQKFLPKQNPIGRHFNLGAPFHPPGAEIIGVAADSKYYALSETPKPMAFFSAWQSGGREAYVGELLIRTSQDASGAAAEVRQAMHQIDSRLPILDVSTLRRHIDNSLDQERMITNLCSFFGLLALLLASIGLYGTIAYSVVRRTNEIGIRMALGAQRPQVLWMVLREAVVLIILGLMFGLPLALGATRWIKSFLFGTPPVDLAGIGAAIVLMIAVSALAGFLPARRATKVDPMEALRYE